MMLTARMPPSEELGFERYLHDSYASLVARLRGRFSERVAAEDVVQEALLRAWQMDTRGERIRALEPWMTAVAPNLARSRWRTMNAEDRALEKLAMDRSSDPSQVLQSLSAAGFVGPVASAIAQLSSRQRQVVVLHYYGDLAVGEIAGRLGVSEGTVKRTLHDARRALRRLVGAEHELKTPRRWAMPGWHMAGSHPGQYEHGLAEDTYEGKPVARLRCSVRSADGFGTLMQTGSTFFPTVPRTWTSLGSSISEQSGSSTGTYHHCMRSTPLLVEAKPLDGYSVCGRFEDGTSGEVDLSYLRDYGGVFEPLRDPDYFRRLRVDPEAGTIIWPNGADIAPETLYAHARGRTAAAA